MSIHINQSPLPGRRVGALLAVVVAVVVSAIVGIRGAAFAVLESSSQCAVANLHDTLSRVEDHNARVFAIRRLCWW